MTVDDEQPVSVSAPSTARPSSADDVDVAVNLLWCVPGGVGGSEEYLVRQLLGLADQRAEFAPRLYVLRSFVEAHPDLADLYPVVVSELTGHQRPRRILAEHTWLARRTAKADLVHHGGGTAPSPLGPARRIPTVVTLHDLQFLTHPDYHGRAKLGYLRFTVPRSLRQATIITTPTEWVRRTVIDYVDIDPSRVMVVPHGIEARIGADAPSEHDLRQIYGLGTRRVLVLPAITHPHKGHDFLLRLMAEHWTDPDLCLVLLGAAGRSEAHVAARISELGLQQRVVRAGRVPATHRDGLMALAEALVFPSEYEGFGAPVVEAMALGTPVIAADQPAVAEVIGEAGIVLPRTLDAWAGALDAVAAQRSALVEAGRVRVADFTAERSGTALLAAYRAALT